MDSNLLEFDAVALQANLTTDDKEIPLVAAGKSALEASVQTSQFICRTSCDNAGPSYGLIESGFDPHKTSEYGLNSCGSVYLSSDHLTDGYYMKGLRLNRFWDSTLREARGSGFYWERQDVLREASKLTASRANLSKRKETYDLDLSIEFVVFLRSNLA